MVKIKRKKILVLTEHLGKTAPGRVFETLISELTLSADISIYTCNMDTENKTILEDCNINIIPVPIIINQRITNFINSKTSQWFTSSLKDYLLKKIFSRRINGKDYDLILCLCSAHCLSPLCIGDIIKKKNPTVKFGVYLVDACPNPEWWAPRSKELNIAKYIKKYTRNLDFFISSNSMMLEYEKAYISNHVKEFSYILPVVGNKKIIFPKLGNPKEFIFLYTGTLYGIRSPKKLIDAFKLLLKEHENSRLIFVGRSRHIVDKYTTDIRNKVTLLDFTSNLEPLYCKATALIDIDGDIETDVFLSSKVMNYIYTNRPIICETGRITPARELFQGLKSVILCDHSVESIYKGLKEAVIQEYNFDDREKLLKQIDIRNGVNYILKQIQ